MLYVECGALGVLCLACGFSLALREDCERVCNPENMMVVKFGARVVCSRRGNTKSIHKLDSAAVSRNFLKFDFDCVHSKNCFWTDTKSPKKVIVRRRTVLTWPVKAGPSILTIEQGTLRLPSTIGRSPTTTRTKKCCRQMDRTNPSYLSMRHKTDDNLNQSFSYFTSRTFNKESTNSYMSLLCGVDRIN